jgi:hypothetical protein
MRLLADGGILDLSTTAITWDGGVQRSGQVFLTGRTTEGYPEGLVALDDGRTLAVRGQGSTTFVVDGPDHLVGTDPDLDHVAAVAPRNDGGPTPVLLAEGPPLRFRDAEADNGELVTFASVMNTGFDEASQDADLARDGRAVISGQFGAFFHRDTAGGDFELVPASWPRSNPFDDFAADGDALWATGDGVVAFWSDTADKSGPPTTTWAGAFGSFFVRPLADGRALVGGNNGLFVADSAQPLSALQDLAYGRQVWGMTLVTSTTVPPAVPQTWLILVDDQQRFSAINVSAAPFGSPQHDIGAGTISALDVATATVPIDSPRPVFLLAAATAIVGNTPTQAQTQRCAVDVLAGNNTPSVTCDAPDAAFAVQTISSLYGLHTVGSRAVLVMAGSLHVADLDATGAPGTFKQILPPGGDPDQELLAAGFAYEADDGCVLVTDPSFSELWVFDPAATTPSLVGRTTVPTLLRGLHPLAPGRWLGGTTAGQTYTITRDTGDAGASCNPFASVTVELNGPTRSLDALWPVLLLDDVALVGDESGRVWQVPLPR